MTATAFWHLAWKEYRVNRAYWLSLVVLVTIAEAVTASQLRHSPKAANLFLLEWALVAPVLFAVGSAGMAFATEREDGTLEFLRGAAVSPMQLLASKFFVTFLATASLYVVLWPIAFYFSAGEAPAHDVLIETICLWAVAAFEAIAWGTFFSLLGAGPLLAICEAIFVIVVTAFLIVGRAEQFSLAPASAAAPWRILIAATVLAIDVYLADFWPDRESGEPWLHTIMRQRARSMGIAPAGDPTLSKTAARIGHAVRLKTAPLAARVLGRDRSMALGRLLWQQWRQSARAMVVLSAMYIALVVARKLLWMRIPYWFPSDLCEMALWALCGCFVFRADQRRHEHRFFAEQNVRPTYIWLSRIVPWLALFLVLEIGFSFLFGREGESLQAFLSLILVAMLLPLAAFSIGQWTSMFIRSAIVAVALAAAGCFTVWVWFNVFSPILWGKSFWISLLLFGPIPAVLLASTWLRSRDWIFENRTWWARSRAALVLLIPAVAIVAGNIWHRVNQVPLVSPGFNIATIDRPISAEAAKTEKLYRLAGLRFVGRGNVGYDDRHSVRDPEIGRNTAWIAANAEALKMALEASNRPSGELYNPETADSPQPPNITGLAELVFTSGDQLLDKGDLDAALDRYLAALRIVCQFDTTSSPDWYYGPNRTAETQPIALYFSAFPRWAAGKGQTAERIDAALDRLRQIDPSILHLRQKIEWHYAFARHRLLTGDESIFPDSSMQVVRFFGESAFDNLPLFPWDRERALRMLSLVTAVSLERLRAIDDALAERSGIEEYVPDSFGFGGIFWIKSSDNAVEEDRAASDQMWWLATTRPTELRQIGLYGLSKANDLADFESARRATMLQLAIQSYRLKHGSLPKSLGDLVGASLQELPVNPYTGKDFQYYPDGVDVQNERNWSLPGDDFSTLHAGSPGIWCDGADQDINGEFVSMVRPGVIHLTGQRDWQTSRGAWFPIPKQNHCASRSAFPG